jgi:hypothetical protein
MAVLKNDIDYTGSVGNKSYYKRRDIPGKTFVREKGGASRKKIKTSKSFVNTRMFNKEFGGCSKAGTSVRRALFPLRHMADYNISTLLNSIAKKIQKMDSTGLLGQRAIAFSKYKQWLDGFSYNKQKPISGVVQNPFQFSIVREEGKATVKIPALVPKINFQNKYNNPLVRFTATLGILSDFVYNPNRDEYVPKNPDVQGKNSSATTEWHSAFMPVVEENLTLQLDSSLLSDEANTLILALGIEFGNPLTNTLVEQIKYSGSAIILGTA